MKTTTAAAHRERLRSIVRELGSVRLGGASVLDEVLPDVRVLVDADLLGIYSVREYATGWQLDLCHLHGVPGVGDGMKRLFERRDVPVVYYDLAAPATAERNRLLESTSLLDCTQPGGWRGCALNREVMRPLGLGGHKHHRMLLCEGPSLLAWFGALCDRGLTAIQRRVMYAIAGPLRRRLWTERVLESKPRAIALLDASLAQISRPAFVLAARGTIVAANAAAHSFLAAGAREARNALRDALAGRSSSFELTELRESGVGAHWLAVARSSSEQQLACATARATTRWHLTARQTQVLALLARGLTNTAIAAELSLSIRATELHVTALLDKAGVHNRAALVAAVLL